MKIGRSIIKMGNMLEDHDNGFIPGTMRERVEMVWEITVSLWAVSTKGNIHVESGLQRDVAGLQRDVAVLRRGAYRAV